jgi:hypothetical protein
LTLLGEELVLYRGAGGVPALMELRCAHCGVVMDFGCLEDEPLTSSATIAPGAIDV